MEKIENQIIEFAKSELTVDATKERILTVIGLNEDLYAIDTVEVLEIIRITELIRPECLAPYVAGLFEYKGEIINIVDLRIILNLEPYDHTLNSMIVIVKKEDSIFGIIADKVIDNKKVDEAQINTTPNANNFGFIKSIYSEKEKQHYILDLASIDIWIKENLNSTSENKGYLHMPTDEKSVEILKNRRQNYYNKTSLSPYEQPADNDDFITFFAGEDKYCIKMKDIKSLHKLSQTKIIKVPCTPDFILGLINLKGDFLCIIDVRAYFHSQPSPTYGSGTIIVIDSDEFKIGLLADAIGTNIEIKPEDIKKASRGEGKSELIQYVKEDDLILIIDTEQMLSNDKLYIR